MKAPVLQERASKHADNEARIRRVPEADILKRKSQRVGPQFKPHLLRA